MSRPLRIEYPNAWYHVMNRGRRGDNIFIDTKDYRLFVELLKETAETWNARIGAYCLMPNHYHLLIQTPDANISRCMRHLNGVYTQRFNRTHHCDGQLFRGRYKSILVDADSYLLQLVRYIHRNPLRAGLTDRLGSYGWSSHKGYLSKAKKWDWLHKDYILSMLSRRREDWLRAYRQFVASEDDEQIIEIFERKKWPSFLGADRFVRWVKETYYSRKKDEEIPQAKELAPSFERIKRAVCDFYGIGEERLLVSRRGVFNEPRNMAIFLTRRLRSDSLKQICDQFEMAKYSSVSSIIERMKALVKKERKLRKRVNKLISELMSQEQT